MKQLLRNDMTEGSLLGKMIHYAIPVILTGILQLLFNAADMIVVGRYAGNDALAAVGATGTLINLIVNLAMGLSVGTAVITAQYYGAKDRDGIKKVVSTSVATAIVAGIIVTPIFEKNIEKEKKKRLIAMGLLYEETEPEDDLLDNPSGGDNMTALTTSGGCAYENITVTLSSIDANGYLLMTVVSDPSGKFVQGSTVLLDVSMMVENTWTIGGQYIVSFGEGKQTQNGVIYEITAANVDE